jgi:hypothetical protein
MSIKSTKNISREDALTRINVILKFIKGKNYRALEDAGFETDISPAEFMDLYSEEISSIDNPYNYTNGMLEDIMDMPYFRWSLFDNYFVNET